MRTILFTFALVAASTLMLVSGVPITQQAALCPSLPVQLELRTSPTLKNKYQLVFASVDPTQSYQQADFVDIHYRVNNDDSVNLRVVTQDAQTQNNQPAKQAQIDGITLQPGDALRAYATYSAKGYACDTPIHTFSAPEIIDQEQLVWNQQLTHKERQMNHAVNKAVFDHKQMTRGINQNDVDQFMTQAQAIDSGLLDTTLPVTTQSAVCPAIPLDQDIVKITGLDNTYMLTFENRDPTNQLHYVDLHLTTDPAQGWDNLRLASDMQLSLAHKVMQPGIVVKPNETLKWYWSYRTSGKDGQQIIDCTTPVEMIHPSEVTHEISLAQITAAARSA